MPESGLSSVVALLVAHAVDDVEAQHTFFVGLSSNLISVRYPTRALVAAMMTLVTTFAQRYHNIGRGYRCRCL